MIYISCGFIIGIVMGLTGAGGALVSIPLFMHFMGMTLIDASVYSLLSVVIASLFNFIAQRNFADSKVALVIFFFSIISSYIVAPLKGEIPLSVVATLLISISLYAVYSIWFSGKGVVAEKSQKKLKNTFLLTMIMGLILGALTTITGLGGGVFLMPIFINIFLFSQSEAVATSLLAVALSSSTSLLLQIHHGFHMDFNLNIFYLIFGILTSAIILKSIMKKISPKILSLVRKIVFTSIVVLAIMKISLT